MNTENQSPKIHPLLATAAVALIVACLVGIAAMTGILPNFHKTAEQPATASAVSVNQEAPAPLPPPPENPPVAMQAPAPAPAPVQAPQPVQQYRPAQNKAAPKPVARAPAPVRQAPAVCSNCGEVIAVRAIQHEAPTSGVGAVGGAVVGGLIGNQIGSGTGNTLATIAGAVGGGYAGNAIEKRVHTTTSYEVTVRMDNGKTRRFNMREARWSAGDLVRVNNGVLVAR